MTTSKSPIKAIKEQALKCAIMLKKAERGEYIAEDVNGNLRDARKKLTIEFAVVMDDKILKIEMTWVTIRETSQNALVEYIDNYMRGSRVTLH